jgi:HK97 family phage prohead protease
VNDHGPIEIRTAALETVAYPQRLIELIAVPYDQWTEVEHNGRWVQESVAPGAFGAIENRARKFLVNMEHDPARWVGRVTGFPKDTTGLRVHVQVRRTVEGDQALDDAADGMLGASVGMGVARGDQQWDGNRRRIHKAFLDHVALTCRPAYVGAEVIDVRHHPSVVRAPVSSTPNLDEVLAQRRSEERRP